MDDNQSEQLGTYCSHPLRIKSTKGPNFLRILEWICWMLGKIGDSNVRTATM